jgi:glycosyltransferase involved in cell wall biosynthesis
MRILQISSARHFGGGERHFVDLTNGLIERGHEITVAIAPRSPILPELRSGVGQNIFELSSSNAANIGKAFALRGFVREHEIEIVHAHMARDYPMAALAVGTGRRARFVITRHVLFPMSSLHRITRRRVARVIAVSQSVAANLASQGIFHKDQIVVVPNGIDLTRFHPRVEGQASRGFRVGILGELTANKGQIEFIRAAQIVASEIKDAEFVIAGRDNSAGGEYGRQVQQLIEATGLQKRIQVIESRIDVAEFLASLDVLVSASRSEAFGLAIVEAMAVGVPVVATATGGAREIVADNETGRLVEIGDINALAQAISQLLNDPDERRRISENARQIVAERFSVERMLSDTEAIYREVLSG